MALILFLAISLVLQGALGELVCEELPVGICSFAISSHGNRCLLETFVSIDGTTEFQCKTSQVLVNDIREHIETDECITACGLDRSSVGISSDTLLEPQSAAKICSPDCSRNCPNVADLYHNLAQAEGVNLSELCKALRTNPRRALTQVLSSGAASGPVSSAEGPITGPAPGPVSSTPSSGGAPPPL